MLQNNLIHDMKNCLQTDTQSVYQHGISVRDYTFQLINILNGENSSFNFKLPDWLLQYKKEILQKLLSKDIIEEYTLYHDCGKPYCIQYDNQGKRHFPNHAELSAKKWLEVNGNKQVSILMEMDMDIHLLKNENIDELISRSQAITLLLVGLAEIHSNSQMFGGIDSVSFKIKWKQINKKGKMICKKLFGEII